MTPGETTVDVDVHHLYADESELVPYLEEGYAERFEEYGHPLVGGRGLNNSPGFEGLWSDGPAGRPRDGETPTETVRRELLDGHGVEVAVLTGSEPFWAPSSMPTKPYANALCRAYNDYTIEHWLAADDRFRYAMTVNHHDPAAAAAEIERVGDHPGVVAVNLAPRTHRPLGNEAYHPMYEACAAVGLPVTIHRGHGAGGIHKQPPTSAGYPTEGIEERVVRHSQIQAQLSSFVFEGTFDTFPGLRVACLEWGWTWLPAYLWRLDQEWKNMRTEVPWIESPPSDLVLERVRLDAQPVEGPSTSGHLAETLDWIDGDRLLMYGSDFPRRDVDDPATVLPSLSASARERVLAGNALEFFSPA
jgi:hypothetical protein